MSPSPSQPFYTAFLDGLLRDFYSVRKNRRDELRHGPAGLSERLKKQIFLQINRLGFARREFRVERVTEYLQYVTDFLPELERTYGLMADDYSRRLLCSLMRYRILGGEHVELCIDYDRYWKLYDSVDARHLKERRTVRCGEWDLNHYSIPGTQGPLSLHLHPLNVLNTFLLEQYAYRHHPAAICVSPGDVVIDCGGCWGDTALYFADKTGPAGKVFSFEFVAENLAIFSKNLALNPHLAALVKIIEHPVGGVVSENLSYLPAGPGTTLASGSPAQAATTVTTRSIDQLAEAEGLDRVDFIKLDIEGFEMEALKGAEQTIRKCRPVLAVALYHKPNDLFEIPNYLAATHDGYDFFLDHFTTHLEESMLFAVPMQKITSNAGVSKTANPATESPIPL